MFNSEESYRERGRKAARALNLRDQGAYNIQMHLFNRALISELRDSKIAAQKAWDEGFKEVRNAPSACLL